MAEYYPLLARAVATLRDAPAEKRRAIYDRARGALIGQLRSMRPSVPEEAIARESDALDDAIARLELEMPGATQAEAAQAAPSPPPPPAAVEIEPPPAPDPVAPPAPAAPASAPDPIRPLAQPLPARPSAPPVAIDPAVPSAPALSRPRLAGMPRSSLVAPPRGTSARPAAQALTRIIADQGQDPPVVRILPDDEARGRAPALTRVSAPLPSAPKLQVPSFSDALAAVESDGGGARDDAPGASSTGREDVMRPAAPRPVVREKFNPRFIILAAIGLLVVAGIGYTAWRLRDKPEALARSRAALAAAEQAASQQAGKISNRADGGASTPPAASTAAPAAAGSTAPVIPAPMPDTDASAIDPPVAVGASASSDVIVQQTTPATPDGVAQQATPPTNASTSAAPQTPTTPLAPTDAGIPVAQRAAFLVEAPDEQSKVKTYVGTVVWRSDNVSPGQNQPLAQAVRADIDVPDIGLKLTMLIQKNFEQQFPASHTLDLRFSLPQNSPLGNVKQIDVPQMRQDDSQGGDPLLGLPVTITENYFLVGLSRGEATAHNLDLIQTRNWFDIPVMMTTGKYAKVTFEKGATGQKVLDAVVQSWQ